MEERRSKSEITVGEIIFHQAPVLIITVNWKELNH
jgi:hypothetical protein